MATKTDKKEHIRKQIIDASYIYRDNLAGKAFLYVIGDEYFEVVFQTDRFMHLTGVNSRLSAQEFYDKAKESELTTGQIFFDSRLTMVTCQNSNRFGLMWILRTQVLTFCVGMCTE